MRVKALCTQLLAITFLLLCSVCIPNLVDETDLVTKVTSSLAAYDARNVTVGRRSLVIYHVGENQHFESLDVAENNIKLFVSAIEQHSTNAEHQAIYIFRIDSGKLNNLFHLLPQGLPNVVILRSSAKFSYLQTHIQTVHMLTDPVALKFHSMLFLNHYARGPFEDRINGGWWKHLINPFTANSLLGLLGSTISCEVTPHVQAFAFIMRTKVALDVFAPYHPRKAASIKRNSERIEFAITNSTLKLGYEIASIYYQRRHHQSVFRGRCADGRGDTALKLSNPGGWCDVLPQTTLFMRWGSLPYRGFYCDDVIEVVQEATIAISQAETSLQLVLPETIEGGHFYPLVKEYNLEVWKDRFVVPHKTHSLTAAGVQPEKVCFLVRSAFTQAKNLTTNTVAMDLHEFIKSLLRQSNPNWDAYFFVTDDHLFDDELKVILSKYGDIRLKYLEIAMKFRPKYDPVNAAYPASDEAMRIVSQKPQCAWLSVTNGDNIYGSAAVHSILTPVRSKPNLVMLPMSSRNFDSGDCMLARYLRNKGTDLAPWSDWCRDFEHRYLKKRYGFARVPSPHISAVDVAQMFIERKKFVATNIYFNDYSSAKVVTCTGCQDGAWANNMVEKHGWTHYSHPISSLSTMVFHGPSPLWCIAAGHVWFEHARKKTVCLSHKTLRKLYPHQYIDWEGFYYSGGPRFCLRLTADGFKIANTTMGYVTVIE